MTASSPRATDRGLSLLRVVADHAAAQGGVRAQSGISLADAARAVELTPSTALRQLRALEAAGFALRDTDGRYLPGPELLRIARSLGSGAALPRLADDVLLELADATGESAYLAEPLDERTAVYSAMQPGRHTVRHVSWLGHRITRRATAVGAALVGRLEPDGVAVKLDAVEDGTTAVSAPVRDATGEIIAAVSVVGPSFRLCDDTLHVARRAVAEQAAVLSAMAGAAVPAGDRTPSGRAARTP